MNDTGDYQYTSSHQSQNRGCPKAKVLFVKTRSRSGPELLMACLTLTQQHDDDGQNSGRYSARSAPLTLPFASCSQVQRHKLVPRPPGKHKRSGSATCYRIYSLPMDYMKLCASSTLFRAPTKQAVASRLDVLPAPGRPHHLPTICLNSCIDEGLLNTLHTSLGPHRCWLDAVARNRLNLGTLNRPGQRARRWPDTHTQHFMQTPQTWLSCLTEL